MAQTDKIYMYEFGGSYILLWADLQRQQTEKAKAMELQREGKNKADYLSICQLHFWHSSGTTMKNISLPFKLECVK